MDLSYTKNSKSGATSAILAVTYCPTARFVLSKDRDSLYEIFKFYFDFPYFKWASSHVLSWPFIFNG